MADQYHLAAVLVVPLGLPVHLADQGAGGVHVEQLPPLGLGRHLLGHAVGREDHRNPVGHLREVLDEDRALGLQSLHHIAVMHDLVAHVDRRAVLLQGALDDLDGPFHPGAEAARVGQKNGQRHFAHDRIRIPLRHFGYTGRGVTLRRPRRPLCSPVGFPRVARPRWRPGLKPDISIERQGKKGGS
jgi:hypothetical protein